MANKPPVMRAVGAAPKARTSWNHGGKSAKDRGYGREHRKLREQLLRQEPLCRLCQQKKPPRVTQATVADHIVSIAKGGPVHDINNLEPLCEPCHRDKSLRERGFRVRPKIGLSGWPEE